MTHQHRGVCECEEPIHNFFNLTYASYKVLPRSVLQSMPLEWQQRFVACLEELEDVAPDDAVSRYRVLAIDERGRFVRDPYRDYGRGRRRVALKGDSK